MSFPPQLLTSTQHYACFLNFSLFRVNYMKEHFDRSLLYEDPPHTVTTAKIELGLQKELQWLTPLFKLYGNIWLSHSNLSATWWQDGMGGLLVFKKSMGSCIMGNLGFSVGPGLGQKKKSNSVVSPQFLFVLLLNFHLQRTIMGTFKCLCQFLRWYFSTFLQLAVEKQQESASMIDQPHWQLY